MFKEMLGLSETQKKTELNFLSIIQAIALLEASR